ncbi:ribosome maturation factor RimM [Nevskia ramosa]|uniref:ribosome maturation factor RimM n=1 Tax=Nevskia ramosa TaxID=64002 RepID=UPI003D12DDAD
MSQEGGHSARRVTLGRVAGVFGVKGWVKIVSNTRPAENLLKYPLWWLGADDGYASALVDAKAQVNGIIAQLSGRDGQPITDRDIAARLVGKDISVDRTELPPAPAGSYYWADLIGMSVVSNKDEPLGTVTGMMENGVQDVLVLSDGEVERLIPFVQGPIILSVDTEARRIVAEWAPDY